MKRIIKWYKLLFDRQPIIIPATQLCEDQKPTQLKGAARFLVETFGLNVLIDCLEYALTDYLTGRERILGMESMSKEMLFKIQYLEGLFKTLKQQGNEELILEIFDVTPLLLIELNSMLSRCESEEQKNVMKNLEMAKSDIRRINTRPHMKEVCSLINLFGLFIC